MPDVPGWENGTQSANEDLEDLELPETFILYHGPADPAQLRRLAECWSWAAGPIGDYYPLLLIGLSDKEQSDLAWLIKAYRMEDSLRPLPPISPAALAWLFRRCSAVFHPAPSSPWGGSVHHALACGKPFVALDTPLTSSIVGPAAYLVPDEEASSLGAAIITVIVEEQVADQLSKAALQRSADWDKDLYGNQLASVYQDIVG
jgi:glycosyltransferase involved in cell wall biosynthesis